MMRTERIQSNRPIAEALSTATTYVRQNMWADAVWDFLWDHGIESAPVLDEAGRPVGTVWKDDLASVDRAARRLTVDQVMRPARCVLPLDAPVTQAQDLMTRENTREIVVVDRDGTMVGVFGDSPD